ncbi:MAG: YcxB family protein [Lachnospiraceae bacterium]
MSAEFDISMTPKAMRNYRFYHKYTRFSGILEILLGIFLAVFCVFTIGKTQIAYTLMVGFVAAFFLVIMPVGMAVRAGRTVGTSKRFKAPTHYVMDDEKMVVSMAGDDGQDISATVSYNDIYSVRETKVSLLVYFTPVSANILPKDQLGDQLDVVKEIFRKNMNPFTAKLK